MFQFRLDRTQYQAFRLDFDNVAGHRMEFRTAWNDAAFVRQDKVVIEAIGMTDRTPPTVSIGSPASGATVSGTVNVTANASDNVGVSKVDFYVDGALKGSATSSPYSFALDTTLLSNGSHSLQARAYDAVGNVGVSISVSVNVGNGDISAPAVAISAPSNGSTISGLVNVAASATDNIGVTKVNFCVDGKLKAFGTAAPYSFALESSLLANAPHQLLVKAYDAAGNTSKSQVSVTVSNPVSSSARVLAVSPVSSVAPTRIVSSGTAFGAIAVDVPAESFSSEVMLTLKVPESLPALAGSEGLKATGVGLEITLGRAVQPEKAATIEMSYTAAEVEGVDLSKLIIARYDEASAVWLPLESISYPELSKVVGKTNHFSLFQIMARVAADLSGGRIYPNPVYPNRGQTQVTMDRLPEGTKVRIYTIHGELVWEGKAGALETVSWPVINKAGRKVASGLYLVHFENGGKKKIKKVSVVK